MKNKYPLWKYLLIVMVLIWGVVYAIPNIYAPDPAIQISSDNASASVEQVTLDKAEAALKGAGVDFFGAEIQSNGNALIRLRSRDQQLRAQSSIASALGHNYIVALNLAATTPKWLVDIGANPMKLGLDLSGGVHFLLEVDIDSAVHKRLDGMLGEIKSELREKRLRGFVTLDGLFIRGTFRDQATLDAAADVIKDLAPRLEQKKLQEGDQFVLQLRVNEVQIAEIEQAAVSQNLTTLRNRVNELGVAEPLVQKQGRNRIVVELPGVQDTAEAKRILGKTANLEFRLEAAYDDAASAKEEFPFREGGRRAWLQRQVVIAGESVADAQSSFDENGNPQVNITLDSAGGKLMHNVTKNNIKRNLGVLFIERKTRTRQVSEADGSKRTVAEKFDIKEIISLATIQSALGVQFRITGLDSPQEASDLALLLRAGALAAPMDFVEERTVGPSLGAENIQSGVTSSYVALGLVAVFMLLFFRGFGVIANVALIFNLMMMLATMSLFSATLTLPGIAGIALSLGMAVDANVLINCRIREEMAAGNSPQAAIFLGYDRAFLTIMDSNVTTLLVGLVLYAIGTGPVRGFAVTLMIGIATSMFTSVTVTRAMVNLVVGGRPVKKLWV
jgi:preprotein translocase subunit SecD